MTTIAKQAYYETAGMREGLARRYYRHLAGARRVLDLGCGTGSFAHYKPQPDMEIYGVDHDPGAVERAWGYAETLCLDLDDGDLPWEDGWFDGVLAKDVLEHLNEPEAIVRELRRVLRPGGVVVASVVMAKPKAVWADYTHKRGFTATSARLLFEDQGFSVDSIWRMGGVPLSSRLGLIDLVPGLLRVPPAGWLWASSWELIARR